MAAKLVIEEGDLKGLSLTLGEGQSWTIGRDPDECQLVIEDPLVSRKHLLAERTPEGIQIKNLSHTNPALLNDEEIDDQVHLLQNGDTLKIGNEVLRFYEDSSIQVLDETLPLVEESESKELEDTSGEGEDEDVEAAGDKAELEASPNQPEKIEEPLVPKEEIEIPKAPQEEIKIPTAAKEEIPPPHDLKEEMIIPPIPEEKGEVPAVLEEKGEVPAVLEEKEEVPAVLEEKVTSSLAEEIVPSTIEETEKSPAKEEMDVSSAPEEERHVQEKIEPSPSSADEEIEKPLIPEEEMNAPPLPENESADIPADENDDTLSHEREIPMTHDEKNLMSDAAPSAAPQPTPTPPPSSFANEQSAQQDTILGDENDQLDGSLAEIDFGVIETGRWLLKVISGPNNGAEFYMQAGNNYVIGTDPQGCDIVFHDTSVSRQHARITVSPEDAISIEDLKSRNGVLINGTPIENKQELSPNIIVTLGTTSFIVYDREGEMQTIISPLLPSIMKALKQEPEKVEQEEGAPKAVSELSDAEKAQVAPQPVIEEPPPPKTRPLGSYIVISTILGFFVLAGIGTINLFRDEPVVTETYENADALIQQTLQPFPSIRWTFNKTNGGLLLLGHVTSMAEKNQLLYNLGTLKFIKNIDDNGIIIDEGVWNEINSLLANNPAWKGISVRTTAPGQFILSGELKTRKQSEQLSSYLNLNFPYLDLLKKEIVVEEDVINQIESWLQDSQLPQVTPSMANDEIVLNGTVPPDKANELNSIIAKIKQIPGVRVVTNLVRSQAAETATILNITSSYPVTGHSRIGNKYTVVINGHILSEEGELDGMTITKITANRVYLEKDGDKFRIDY